MAQRTGMTVWTEHAHRELARAGHRAGGAREEVLALLARQDCCLTAQEIADRLRAERGGIGTASVYRALELLVEHGLAQRLDLGQGVARYEVVDPHGDHHHHLLCERCGRLVPFDDGDLERSIERLAARHGFRVADHEVILHGACARCETPAA